MYKGEHKKMNFFCINIYRIKLFANDAKMKYIKRFLEKLGENFNKEPEKIINVEKKLVSGLIKPKYEINHDESYESSKEDSKIIEFPLFSTYVNLSPRQFNMVSEKYAKFCQLFYSEEFIKAAGKEGSFVFMITGIPMKKFLEVLNQ